MNAMVDDTLILTVDICRYKLGDTVTILNGKRKEFYLVTRIEPFISPGSSTVRYRVYGIPRPRNIVVPK